MRRRALLLATASAVPALLAGCIAQSNGPVIDRVVREWQSETEFELDLEAGDRLRFEFVPQHTDSARIVVINPEGVNHDIRSVGAEGTYGVDIPESGTWRIQILPEAVFGTGSRPARAWVKVYVE